MTKILDLDRWPSTVTSPVPTVHTNSPLAQHQGTTMPTGATAPKGTCVPAAGFRASGVDVQGQGGRMAVIYRNRLADVPGVLPRGAPV
jgi:hypothetical protein